MTTQIPYILRYWYLRNKEPTTNHTDISWYMYYTYCAAHVISTKYLIMVIWWLLKDKKCNGNRGYPESRDILILVCQDYIMQSMGSLFLHILDLFVRQRCIPISFVLSKYPLRSGCICMVTMHEDMHFCPFLGYIVDQFSIKNFLFSCKLQMTKQYSIGVTFW